MKGRGVKRTLLWPGRKPFTRLFAMSHWGKRLKLAKKESESSGERLISPRCPFVVPISPVQCHCPGLVL